MQNIVRNFITNCCRGNSQSSPVLFASVSPVAGDANVGTAADGLVKDDGTQVMAQSGESGTASICCPLPDLKKGSKTTRHNRHSRSLFNAATWSQFDSQRPFRFVSDEILDSKEIDQKSTLGQKPKKVRKLLRTAHALRNLGRTYLIKSRLREGSEYNFHKLGRQAWHLGTAMLVANQDLRARMDLCESTRLLADQLSKLLQQLQNLPPLPHEKGKSPKFRPRKKKGKEPKKKPRGKKGPPRHDRTITPDPQLPGQS